MTSAVDIQALEERDESTSSLPQALYDAALEIWQPDHAIGFSSNGNSGWVAFAAYGREHELPPIQLQAGTELLSKHQLLVVREGLGFGFGILLRRDPPHEFSETCVRAITHLAQMTEQNWQAQLTESRLLAKLEHVNIIVELSQPLLEPTWEKVLPTLQSLRKISGGDLALITNQHGEREMPVAVSGFITNELDATIAIGLPSQMIRDLNTSLGVNQRFARDEHPLSSAMRHFGIKSALILKGGDFERPLAISFYSVSRDDGWSASECALIERASGVVFALVNRLLAKEQLARGFESALKSIGFALEMRDAETAGHTLRVTHLAGQLAEHLHLPADQQRHLRWGAYLHDVGKLCVPDGILHKPGRLTSSEWQVMQQHTVWGEQLMSNVEFLPPEVLDLIRHHHERPDGMGYPDGVSEIALITRIFSICDKYDALTSDRPYRPALTPVMALELLEIEALEGKIDAELLAIFVQMVDVQG